MLFTGNANPVLAAEIAHHLGTQLGAADVGRFSDGEVTVEIKQNVRAREVFVVQSTCAPTNENLMELLIMVDALKRASAGRISAVIPYFGYARQDRRPRSSRVPITAKVVANMLQAVGVDRVLTMDLHADQIQGFFDIPVDNIYASPVLLGDLRQKNYEDLIVVSPDVGGVVRARALAKQLGCDLAIIDKRRPKANVSEVMHVIGEIEGRNCVIMDDMIDTAGTLVKAAEVLKERGAKKVYAYCTHPIFSGPAIERISKGDALDEVVVTNTIPLTTQAAACTKIRQLSLDHNALWHALKKEAFHASILDMEFNGQSSKVLLRDYQMHPYKQLVQHIDFQRVDANTTLHMKVPLHFSGEEESEAVKTDKCLINHVVTEIEVACLPANLPEFIAVDLKGLTKGVSLHLNDITLPAGCKAITHGKKNPVLVSVVAPVEEVVDYQLEIWNAVAAPASMPAAVASKLSAMVSDIVRAPEMRARLFQQGWQVVGSSPEGLRNRIESDTKALGDIIRSQKIELN
eukprot:gene3417-3345_t